MATSEKPIAKLERNDVSATPLTSRRARACASAVCSQAAGLRRHGADVGKAVAEGAASPRGRPRRGARSRYEDLWRCQLKLDVAGEREEGASKAHGSLRRPLVGRSREPHLYGLPESVIPSAAQTNHTMSRAILDTFQIMPAQWFFCLRGSGAVAPSAPALKPVSPAAHVDWNFLARAPFSA
jgi:hypothetical protein